MYAFQATDRPDEQTDRHTDEQHYRVKLLNICENGKKNNVGLYRVVESELYDRRFISRVLSDVLNPSYCACVQIKVVEELLGV